MQTEVYLQIKCSFLTHKIVLSGGHLQSIIYKTFYPAPNRYAPDGLKNDFLQKKP
jgi:hypothetical protein